jgi:hypothetical protein
MNNQALLTSFQAAVNEAISQGIVYNKIIQVGSWELKFAKKPTDRLPVIMHAVYRP